MLCVTNVIHLIGFYYLTFACHSVLINENNYLYKKIVLNITMELVNCFYLTNLKKKKKNKNRNGDISIFAYFYFN